MLVGGVVFWGLKKNDGGNATYLAHWKTLRVDTVNRISVDGGVNRLVVERTDRGWVVDGVAADAKMIEWGLRAVIKVASIKHTKSAALITPKAVLQLTDGAAGVTVNVGQDQSNDLYVWFSGEKTAYQIADMPKAFASASRGAWADTLIAELSEITLSALIFEKPGEERVGMMQKNGTWFTQNGTHELIRKPFEPVFSTLDSFTAADVVVDAEVVGFSTSPTLVVSATQVSGNVVVLQFFPGESSVLVRSSVRDGNFLISKEVFENFQQAFNLLRSQ